LRICVGCAAPRRDRAFAFSGVVQRQVARRQVFKKFAEARVSHAQNDAASTSKASIIHGFAETENSHVE
jgi:hypothetical protein